MGHGLFRKEGKSRVSITKGSKIAQSVARAVELIGGLKHFIQPDSRVLIKPNLGVALPAKIGITTEPRVVAAVIHLVRKAGARRVLVGESTVVGFDADKVFDSLKVRTLFEKAGAEVVNLDRDAAIEIKIPQGDVLKKIKVCRTAYESDVIISVPKLKTHIQTGVTLGLKNMKGTVPDISKRLMHRIDVPVGQREEYGLDRAIVDLNSVLSPDLSIIDGTIALEGFAPGPRLVGIPVRMNTIVASFDPVSADAVTCRIIGVDPLEVRHLRLAHERKLGRVLEDEIEVVGHSISSVLQPMRIEPKEETEGTENILMIEGKGCSGCTVTTRMTLSFYSRKDLEDFQKITLVVGDVQGMDYTPQGRCFFIGNCAMRSCKGKEGFEIGGCPPPGLWIRRGLAASKAV